MAALFQLPILAEQSRAEQSRAEQKLTAGNQPARSLLASGPGGTRGHIFISCITITFFFLFLVGRPL
jgi:hypothetical protein